MRKKLFFLLLIPIFLLGCKNKNDFLLSTIEQTPLGGAYNGLIPGKSSQNEVIGQMSKYNLLDTNHVPNPSVTEYSSKNTVYYFFLLPEANYSVFFYFNNDNEFSKLEFSTEKITIEDFIGKFGEPDSVIFSVNQKRYTSCDAKLFYDSLRAVIFIRGSGNIDKKRCILSSATEVTGLFLLSHEKYLNFTEEFLSSTEVTSAYEDFIYMWRGYGNLFELYPNYPILRFSGSQ